MDLFYLGIWFVAMFGLLFIEQQKRLKMDFKKLKVKGYGNGYLGRATG